MVNTTVAPSIDPQMTPPKSATDLSFANSLASAPPPISQAKIEPANIAGSAPKKVYTGTTTGRSKLASTGEKEIIPTEVFEGCVNVEFEGQIFPAPVGYDLYLRSLYGDYEKDPTKDKQKTHHTFSAFSKF